MFFSSVWATLCVTSPPPAIWPRIQQNCSHLYWKQTNLWGPRERLRVQQCEKAFVKVFPCFFFVCIFVTFTCFRSDLFNQKLHYTEGVWQSEAGYKESIRTQVKEGRLTGLQCQRLWETITPSTKKTWNGGEPSRECSALQWFYAAGHQQVHL